MADMTMEEYAAPGIEERARRMPKNWNVNVWMDNGRVGGVDKCVCVDNVA